MGMSVLGIEVGHEMHHVVLDSKRHTLHLDSILDDVSLHVQNANYHVSNSSKDEFVSSSF